MPEKIPAKILSADSPGYGPAELPFLGGGGGGPAPVVYWDPSELITGGRTVSWWTPDDSATLYQDAGKANVVTAAGQTVRVMEDGNAAARDFNGFGVSVDPVYNEDYARAGVNLTGNKYADVTWGATIGTHTWAASVTPKATNGTFGAAVMNSRFNSANRAYLSYQSNLSDFGGSLIQSNISYIAWGGTAMVIGEPSTAVKRHDSTVGLLDALDDHDGYQVVTAGTGGNFGSTIRTGRNLENGATTVNGVLHRAVAMDDFATAGEMYRIRDWCHGVDFTVTPPFFVDDTTDTPGTQMPDHTPDTVESPATSGPWEESGVNCLIDDAGTGVARDSGAGNDDYLVWDVGTAEGIFHWDYVRTGCGMVWRYNAHNEHWLLFIDNSGTLILYEENFGLSNRGQWAGGITPGAKLQVIHDGTTIKAYCDDILRLEYTSASAHPSYTKFGCRYEAGGGTGSSITLSRGAKAVNSVLGRDLP